MRQKDRDRINSLLDGKLAIDGTVHQAVKVLCDAIGLDYRIMEHNLCSSYPYGPKTSTYLPKRVDDVVREVAEIQAERAPYADVEYTYEISPRITSEEAPEETAAWIGMWWQVILPLTEDETYRPSYYNCGRRVIASGSADTHAEAWAAIKNAIRNHREDRLEQAAFSNMHETNGTVKW